MNDLTNTSPAHNNTEWRSILVTLLTYWVLVMGMWGMFAFDRGLTYETGFPVACQKSLHDCLVYGDTLRPYNSLFLGLGHVLGKGNGSYATYQLLYGLLWWGRGVLTFLIIRRIWSTYPLFAFLIGALVIVHASDGALNWIGQLHQFGFMFCLVLAIYLLLESWLAPKPSLAIFFLVASLLPLYICLWTYESPYVLILSAPVILFALQPQINRRFLATTAVWYILPAIYGYFQVEKYLIAKASTYQTSILRPDMNAAAILHDLHLHLQQSLQFWRWAATLSPYGVAVLAPAIAGLCTIAFIIGAHLLSPPGLIGAKTPPKIHLLMSFAIGLMILILSFPVYLLLAGNTMFWRTQMLSGFGSAIVLSSGILLLTQVMPKRKYRAILAVALCSMIVFNGVRAGVFFQGFHEYRWQIHRNLMSQISHLIPNVENPTLILLTNLPKAYERDPFGATLWFDFPIQLLYPDRNVVGYFLDENGAHSTDNPWNFTAEGMSWQKKGMAQKIDQVSYSQIIALRYEPDGKISLLEEFPDDLLPQRFNTSMYAPHNRISRDFVTNRSIRMFAR